MYDLPPTKIYQMYCMHEKIHCSKPNASKVNTNVTYEVFPLPVGPSIAFMPGLNIPLKYEYV